MFVPACRSCLDYLLRCPRQARGVDGVPGALICPEGLPEEPSTPVAATQPWAGPRETRAKLKFTLVPGSGPARRGERQRAFLAAEAASERRSASTTSSDGRGRRAAVGTMEYGSIDELDKEDAPRQAKRYAVGVVTATALVALGATSAIRTTTSLRATAQNPTGRRVQVHAFADAL